MSTSVARGDGSKIQVEAITWQSTTQMSIRAMPSNDGSKPAAEVRVDDSVYLVNAEEITLDGEVLGSLPAQVKHVRIEIYEDGVRITADGGELVIDTRVDE